MNNWGRDRYNKDRNKANNESPENWTRRPSERYDREDYYRNSNPDHYTSENEEGSWHFAGKFEDKNDPTYSYATRDRDLMREYPTYPMNERDYYQRHPRFGTRSGYGDDSYYGSEGDYRSVPRQHYDRGYSRSHYGFGAPDSYRTENRFSQTDFEAYSPSTSTNTFAGRGPKGWTRSDDSIKEQVCHALEMHPRIDASEIEVEVKDGVVTLSGNIHDRPAKRLAEDTIEFLPGVKDVHNRLTVDKSFFERAKDFLTGDTGASETPSKPGRPERNPRH